MPKTPMTGAEFRAESAKSAALAKRLVENLKDERRSRPDRKWRDTLAGRPPAQQGIAG